MTNLKLGTDPEFFSTVDGICISPALFIKYLGLKPIDVSNEMHPVFYEDNLFKILMDGCAWEIGFKHPFTNGMEMYEITNLAISCLQDFISKYKWEGVPFKLHKKPVVNIIPEMYEKFINREDKYFDFTVYSGFIFGCDKDYDVFNDKYECKTINIMTPLRYGGGHIHVSGNDLFQEYPKPMIKLLAITIGNFVTAKSIYPKEDKIRVSTYGKAGRYREQKYPNGDFGIEYRTPSNTWLSFNLDGILEMEYLIGIANKLLSEKRIDIIEAYQTDTIKAIETCDKEVSLNILKEIYNV